MNIKQYYKLVQNPSLLNIDTLKDIEKLVNDFPLVENFRLLYAFNLLLLDDHLYSEALIKAAIYSSDRKKLKQWIDKLIDFKSSETTQEDFTLKNEEEESIEQTSEDLTTNNIEKTELPSEERHEEKKTEESINQNKAYKTLEEPSNQQEQESLEVQEESISKKELKESLLEQEKDSAKDLGSETEPTTADLKEVIHTQTKKIPNNELSNTLAPKATTKLQSDKEEEEEKLAQEKKAIRSKKDLLKLVQKRLSEIKEEKLQENQQNKILDEASIKSNLIEKFLETEPSISRPDKSEFFDPQNEAVESSIDEDDFFITETLAQIHTQQGNLKKAIEIYQKLILKNPEKSTYFAAQIENLTKS